MEVKTQKKLNRRSFIERAQNKTNKLHNLLLDALATAIISSGICIAFFRVFPFGDQLLPAVLLPALITLFTVLLTRKAWLIPALLGVVSLMLLFMALLGSIWSLLSWAVGFGNWWFNFFPKDDPFWSAGSQTLVQATVAFYVVAVIFFLVRHLFSSVLISLVCGLVFLILSVFGVGGAFPGFCVCLAGLLILVPRSFNLNINKKADPRFIAPRWNIQLIALFLAAVSVLVSAASFQFDTGKFKSTEISRTADDGKQWFLYKMSFLAMEMDALEPGVPLYSIIDSGFQSTSQLGGPVQTDNTPTLYVTADAPLLLRGSVWDNYSGLGWTKNPKQGKFRFDSPVLGGYRDTAFDLKKPKDGKAKTVFDSMTSRISANVTYARASYSIFTCGRPISLSFAGAKKEPLFNMRGEMFTDSLIPSGRQYTFNAVMINRGRPDFDANMLSLENLLEKSKAVDPDYEKYKELYLQLPDELPSAVRNLAAGITSGAGTPYKKAEALERWLQRNCAYTLSPDSPPDGEDFVEYFLETRKGYCTYFATAMTVMARTVGLPARYVTGYSMRAADEPHTYVAMSSTAHAFVEVYFKGIGWVTFDPTAADYSTYSLETPPTPVPVAPDPGPGTGVVVTTVAPPDPGTSTGGTVTPPVTAEPKIEPPKKQSGALPAFLSWVIFFGILFASVAAWVFFKILKFRFAFNREKLCKKYGTAALQARFYFQDVKKQLLLLGLSAMQGETLADFAKRAGSGLSAEGLDGAAQIMSALHFGNIPPSVNEIENLRALHAELEAELRQRKNIFFYVFKRVLG